MIVGALSNKFNALVSSKLGACPTCSIRLFAHVSNCSTLVYSVAFCWIMLSSIAFSWGSVEFCWSLFYSVWFWRIVCWNCLVNTSARFKIWPDFWSVHCTDCDMQFIRLKCEAPLLRRPTRFHTPLLFGYSVHSLAEELCFDVLIGWALFWAEMIRQQADVRSLFLPSLSRAGMLTETL